jgi:hypothetical protein
LQIRRDGDRYSFHIFKKSIIFADIFKYQFLQKMESLITTSDRLVQHANTGFIRYSLIK